MNLKILGLVCSFLVLSTQVTYADDFDNDPINTIASMNAKNSESKISVASNSANKNDLIGNMLLQAVSLMGIPYKWGGNTPETGMDCSGLIRYIYQKSLGINLPRTAAEMAKVGKLVSIDNIKPGDLLFFNTRGFTASHIGLYLGDNQFLQSRKTGTDIEITEFEGYWRSHFDGAKRLVAVADDDPAVMTSYAGIHSQPIPVKMSRKATRKKSKKSRNKSQVTKSKSKKIVKYGKKSSIKKITSAKVKGKKSKKGKR